MCVCGNKSCIWEGKSAGTEVKEESHWSKGFENAHACEIWSSPGGFGLANFMCNSSISALPIEILIQPG